MTTTINGRTPEEIKKGLECCAYVNAPCEGCPFITDIKDYLMEKGVLSSDEY